ncbi:MAG TPA: transposase [Candidatus Acidoferrales bacterium]
MPDWPHAPSHRLDLGGTYMVTSGTYRKKPLFHSRLKLNLLRAALFDRVSEHGAALQAWAIFPNHYHFIGGFDDPHQLRELVSELHSLTARRLNEIDELPGRQVWFQYWETRITYERSYFPRLRYVHENAVRHGLVRTAAKYEWCSAEWLERTASAAFCKELLTFGRARLAIPDDFTAAGDQFKD